MLLRLHHHLHCLSAREESKGGRKEGWVISPSGSLGAPPTLFFSSSTLLVATPTPEGRPDFGWAGFTACFLSSRMQPGQPVAMNLNASSRLAVIVSYKFYFELGTCPAQLYGQTSDCVFRSSGLVPGSWFLAPGGSGGAAELSFLTIMASLTAPSHPLF